jgi:hypothetical protein
MCEVSVSVAVLVKLQVLWDVTRCCWVNSLGFQKIKMPSKYLELLAQ